ncbi:MAG: restriction endonuclease subunit S, partial [bacterium]
MLDVPKIDIRPDHWEIVQGILKKHVPLCEVWAFGSRAKWTAKEYSDLDLAIITDHPLSLDVSASLSDDFSESDLPWRVDVVDWATTSESFRKIMERDKVVVQEGKKRGRGMGEWQRYRLDELCEFINGFAFKSTDYVPASVDTIEVFRMGYIERGGGFKEDDRPVFVPKKYGKKLDKYFLRVGDVTIAMTDMKDRVAILGNTAWIRDENRFVLNQRVGCIRVKQDDLLDPRFLYFYSNWEPHVDYLRSRANSGVQVKLATSAIKDAELCIPPLVEQRAIAHILGTLDDKIELNRKQNETLEAMARALFKAWFVDFEPVRAKMEGRWQRGQSLPGLPAHLFDLFPDKLVESALGEIPDGWELTPLSEFSSLNPESWTKRTRPEVILYVDISNTKWGRIESVTKYEADDAPSRAQRVLRPQDTIIGTVRPGNGSYALISDENLTGSTGFAVLRPLRREYSEFVYLAATAPENIERLSNLADGGAYPAVRPEIVSATQVPYTCKELINEFSRQ